MTLSDREWIYKQIIDFAQDGILFAAETIFGYTSEEAIGKSLDLIVPEKLRERHWKGYLRVMETGESRYGSELLKVPAIRKDGSTISVEFTILLVRNHQNEIIGTAAIIRDVTEGWKQEKELKQKLKFLED
ncbi:MAG: PAS domain S-box protein [Deltaproteobacteria bacterium]|nr:PAS domain S-box protein [Deltaproteobacteria bacterium]